ncbi:MAG: hypothetical protein WCC52_03965, partial [Nitrosotalea sp.]
MKISVKGLVLLGILLSAAGMSPVFAQMANSTGSNSTMTNSTSNPAMNMGSNSTSNPAMNMG